MDGYQCYHCDIGERERAVCKSSFSSFGLFFLLRICHIMYSFLPLFLLFFHMSFLGCFYLSSKQATMPIEGRIGWVGLGWDLGQSMNDNWAGGNQSGSGCWFFFCFSFCFSFC
jgi:hypothetical protein